LAFECKKIAKNLTFKKKPKIVFFSNKLPLAIFLMTIYGMFFLNVGCFWQFFTFKWQFPEGSSANISAGFVKSYLL